MLYNFLLIAFIALCSHCQQTKESGTQWLTWRSIAFNTDIIITVARHNLPSDNSIAEKRWQTIIQQCIAKKKAIEQYASLYYQDSFIQQLNRQGFLINFPTQLYQIMRQAKHYGNLTNGYFDITIQPLWQLYAKTKNPTLQQKQQAYNLVNYRYLILSPSRMTLQKKGMAISLNGMIQGLLADKFYQILKHHGITKALINSGEYRALGGDSRQQQHWSINIWSDYLQRVIATVSLPSGYGLAVSAAKGYQFDKNQQQSHLFAIKKDTKVALDMTFVVIAKNAALADMLATACSVAPRSKWQSWAKHAKQILVYKKEKLLFNSLLQAKNYDDKKSSK